MSAFWKRVIFGFAILAIAFSIVLGFEIGKRRGDAQLTSLTLKLAQSEKTVEVQKNLYATTIVQLDGLGKLLDTSRSEVKSLQKQLADSQAQLLTTQQLVLKWKRAYEGAVGAVQTQDPPPKPGSPPRQRVTFSGLLGPIQVDGYTLTDPAEAHVKIQQTKPVILTVSVAKNPDGTWSSYATSSDDNLDVQVSLGGVDPGVVSPTWRQRIWLNAGADVLGSSLAYVGMSYHWDRFSLGAHCGTGKSCGFDLGFRIFE